MKRVLVTGGAGFIGSHLVDRLINEHEVIVLDDLSGGERGNIVDHEEKEHFRFIEGSITIEEDIDSALEGVDTVFHLAAQPDVRLSVDQPLLDFRINVVGTINILEAMRERDINRFIFASSGGTVYGQTDVFPTPENTPFRPISNYGAAKGAVEMYLSSYAELYGINSVSMRLANIIGPRSTHGVMYDFYMKLKRDPTCLEVLGDGQQEKSYMYVSDTVAATMLLAEKMQAGYQPINVGSGERLKVGRIAELVCEAAGLPDTSIEYTGSKRGWAGDVVITDIDISLLKSYGWKPEVPLEQGVSEYIQWLKETFGPIG
ncbi:MAG: NAD-dependent epimerase/dehydratase family protein [Promethearchaeia archaeon]